MAASPQNVSVRVRPDVIATPGRFSDLLAALNSMCPPRQYVELGIEPGHVTFTYPAPRVLAAGDDADHYLLMVRRAVERVIGRDAFAVAAA